MDSPRTINIHIGLHKTGSSAIQLAFHGYAGPTLVCPKFRFWNQSLPLVNAFARQPETYKANKGQGYSPETIRALGAETRDILLHALRRDRRDILLSAEGLVRLTEDDIHTLRDTLAPFTDRFRIIAFVRDPVAYCNSAFAERLKHGQTAFSVPAPNVRDALEPYLTAFGHDAMHVVRPRPDQDAVTLLSGILGVTPPATRKSHANTAISLPACRTALTVNKALADRPLPERKRALKKILQRHKAADAPRAVLAADLVRTAIDPGDIGWLAATFDIHFDVEASLAKIDATSAIHGPEDLAMTPDDRAELAAALNLPNGSDDQIRHYADRLVTRSPVRSLRDTLKAALRTRRRPPTR